MKVTTQQIIDALYNRVWTDDNTATTEINGTTLNLYQNGDLLIVNGRRFYQSVTPIVKAIKKALSGK